MTTAYRKFEDHASLLVGKYSGLQLAHTQKGKPFLHGDLMVVDCDKKHWATYAVKIWPTPFYPYEYPVVMEVGGKIPRNIDWHVYEQGGHCCLATNLEMLWHCRNGINLVWFMNKVVLPWFFNQAYRERTGFFFKERSHGIKGEFEALFEILKADTEQEAMRLVQLILNIPPPKRNDRCFCGTQSKYRKCHREAFEFLRNGKAGQARMGG